MFDLTLATAGTASNLKTANIDHVIHAQWLACRLLSNAQQMTVRAFSPIDGRLLNQAVGCDGVDKRIDVLSTFIKQEKLFTTLLSLSSATIAIIYSSAKDPVNMAGFVAEKYFNGD